MLKSIFLLLIAVLFIAGCASTEALDGVKREPKRQIDIYSDGKTPTKPFKLIYMFSERDDPEKEAEHHRNFINRAKNMGADGIILRPNEPAGQSFGPFGMHQNFIFKAEAIVYE